MANGCRPYWELNRGISYWYFITTYLTVLNSEKHFSQNLNYTNMLFQKSACQLTRNKLNLLPLIKNWFFNLNPDKFVYQKSVRYKKWHRLMSMLMHWTGIYVIFATSQVNEKLLVLKNSVIYPKTAEKAISIYMW